MASTTIDKQPLVNVAKRLQEMVERKEYNRVLDILDKIKIPDYSTLVYEDVSEHLYDGCEETMIFPSGGVSKYVLTLSNGKQLSIRDKDFWKLVKAENSIMGAWQIFLLENIWTYLPLFWHSNYERRHYFYTKEDFIKYINEERDEKLDIEGIDDIQIGIGADEGSFFKLVNIDNCYVLKAFYWSEHKGLVSHYEIIMFIGDSVHILRPQKETVIIKYDCGIMY